jgi:N-acyl homoserine lactone hydrolase
MRIHALRTGLIDVKRNYYDAKGGNRLLRLSSVLLDSQFIQIPVYVWVIEHPEGVIVIDTGESARVNDPDYFPALQRPFWHSQYRFHVRPEDEVGSQLRLLGIPPEEVRWVLLTHAHFDHTDGLHHFPNSEIIISQKEHDDVYRYRSAHFAFPSKWPKRLKQRTIRYTPERIGAFRESFQLTQAGDVHIVPTPGHTSGHQSIILQDEGFTFFFGGDSSFDLASLLSGTMDAPAVNAPQDLETRRQILDYADQQPLIYLTTHDHEMPKRLEQRITLSLQAQQAVNSL